MLRISRPTRVALAALAIAGMAGCGSADRLSTNQGADPATASDLDAMPVPNLGGRTGRAERPGGPVAALGEVVDCGSLAGELGASALEVDARHGNRGLCVVTSPGRAEGLTAARAGSVLLILGGIEPAVAARSTLDDLAGHGAVVVEAALGAGPVPSIAELVASFEAEGGIVIEAGSAEPPSTSDGADSVLVLPGQATVELGDVTVDVRREGERDVTAYWSATADDGTPIQFAANARLLPSELIEALQQGFPSLAG